MKKVCFFHCRPVLLLQIVFILLTLRLKNLNYFSSNKSQKKLFNLGIQEGTKCYEGRGKNSFNGYQSDCRSLSRSSGDKAPIVYRTGSLFSSDYLRPKCSGLRMRQFAARSGNQGCQLSRFVLLIIVKFYFINTKVRY